MSTRMLIDARHSEETRVTIVKGSRVEEFDYESASRRQLKGNIYLARVTRVEPSLQAAFVEYGGNRHGFLAFSEIHPDYYQIPVEDRDALIAAETEAARSQQQAEDEAQTKPRRRRGRRHVSEFTTQQDAVVSEEIDSDEAGDSDEAAEASSLDSPETGENTLPDDNNSLNEDEAIAAKDSDEEDKDAAIEEAATRRRGMRALKRRYSIQEVIKRRQVLLIQVVKEERGNKGAALTTYLSLAGRYCVLMPNSTHSGGISRKISNISDRKKLKQIISSLGVSEEMGLIVRTAGLQRTKVEIKRDFDYLLRLWNGIRELTLKSTAPALVYEEGNLIKRTIRDLYVREVDEILVEGEEAYRAAKDFMKLLMPSHAKKVQHYKDNIPLFHRYQVESHLEAMYQPVVQLRSGGYIVINPTEALISIDVNSGRATKEHNIEETAIKTNLEAAEEVARQLRLRDMAGLVVIDFIDMEDRSNNRTVERKMKDFLKNDRARIQVGRISSFGLMEMSRQRLRPNLLEISMETCSTCAGMGIVRSVESASIMALRQLEEEGIRGRSSTVRVAANPDVAIYLLNKKRSAVYELEQRYGYTIEILAQPSLGQSDIEITRETGGDIKPVAQAEAAITLESSAPDVAPEVETVEAKKAPQTSTEKEEEQPRKKRRRRRRRRRAGDDNNTSDTSQTDKVSSDNDGGGGGGDDDGDGDEAVVGVQKQETSSDPAAEEAKPATRRRRGTRGGRRRKPRSEMSENAGESAPLESSDSSDKTNINVSETANSPAPETTTGAEDKKPVRRRRRVRKEATEANSEAKLNAPTSGEEAMASTDDTIEEKPKARRTRKASASKDSAATDKTANTETETPKPRQRRTPRAADEKAQPVKTDTAHKASDTLPSGDTEKPKRKPRVKTAPKADAVKADPLSEKPRRAPRAKADGKSTEPSVKTVSPPKATNSPQAKLVEESSGKSTRKGWWQRTFG